MRLSTAAESAEGITRRVHQLSAAGMLSFLPPRPDSRRGSCEHPSPLSPLARTVINPIDEPITVDSLSGRQGPATTGDHRTSA
jgi:hypothetical protein